MNKTKLILIVIAILLIGGLASLYQLEHKARVLADADVERLRENINQLSIDTAHRTTIILKEKELSGKYLTQRDSLAKALKIRPKAITKIVERTITLVEKDTVEVAVNQYGEISWSVQDSGACWKWEADLQIVDDYPELKRTFFGYDNTTIEAYYKRLKWKFLFIHVYDKNKIDVVAKSKCGEEVTQIVEILKNK